MSFLLTTIQYHIEAWQTNGDKFQAAEMRLKARKHLGDDIILVQHKLPFTEESSVTPDFMFFTPNETVSFINLLQGGYVEQGMFHDYCRTLLSGEETTLIWIAMHAHHFEVHAAIVMEYCCDPKQYNVTAFVCRADSHAEGGLWLYLISLADTRRVNVHIAPSHLTPVLQSGMLAAGFMQNNTEEQIFVRFPMRTLLSDVEIWSLLVQQWVKMLEQYTIRDPAKAVTATKKKSDIKHKCQPRL